MSAGLQPPLLLVLLLAHWLGDFVAQSDWMAVNKSKRWDALILHVLIYGGVLQASVLAWVLMTPDWHAALVAHDAHFLAVNTLAHFAIDAVTSRINARLWFFQPVYQSGLAISRVGEQLYRYEGGSSHWFFVMIGFDQLLHVAVLVVTASWWLS